MDKIISVLFARRDSIYKSLGCDVWDIDRNALNYCGLNSVIAHPPCRAWGNFAMFAKPRPGEKELAFFAVDAVRKFGGVLEHPAGSKLWDAAQLPKPGKGFDGFNGWTLGIHQHWFGHKAQKKTYLYIVGCNPNDIPTIPMSLSYPEFVIGDVGRSKNGNKRQEITKVEREATPLEMAKWLIELAKTVKVK